MESSSTDGLLFVLFIALLLISSSGFWLWMLIDCVFRKVPDKVMWICLILISSLIGATLYFFTIRRKLIKKPMRKNDQKQSWISVLVLSIITMGIYIPFWFKKFQKKEVVLKSKKLNSPVITFLIIISILLVILSINFTSTIDGVKNTVSFDFLGIKPFFDIIRLGLIAFLSFKVRNILENRFSVNLNPVLTLFLGPVFLQYKLNILSKRPSSVRSSLENQNQLINND